MDEDEQKNERAIKRTTEASTQTVSFRITNAPSTVLSPAAEAFASHWARERNTIKAFQHAYPGTGRKEADEGGRQLLESPSVRSEIIRVINRFRDFRTIELADIEAQLARITFSDVRALVHCDGPLKGTLMAPSSWDADTAAAVIAYSETEDKDGKVTRKVRFADRNAAARTLAEMKGAFARERSKPGVTAQFRIYLGGEDGRRPRVLGGTAEGQDVLTIESVPEDGKQGANGGVLKRSPQSKAGRGSPGGTKRRYQGAIQEAPQQAPQDRTRPALPKPDRPRRLFGDRA